MRTRAKGIYTETVLVTPDLACEWLEATDRDPEFSNRDLKNHLIFRYARIMREGRWRHNGESMILSPERVVLEGQHRLYGCIEAGTPFRTQVTFNVPIEEFKSMGQGVTRSGGDHMSARREKHPKQLASALRRVACYLLNPVGPIIASRHGGFPGGLDLQEYDDLLEDHPTMREALAAVKGTHFGLSNSDLAFCYYIFASVNAKESFVFMRQLLKGLDCGEGAPAFVLRERFQRANKDRLHPIDKHLKTWFIFRAFQQHANRTRVVKMQSPSGTPRYSDIGFDPHGLPTPEAQIRKIV